MTSGHRRADIPGVETPNTGYTNPDIEWDNPNTEGSAVSQPDAEALDEAFHEDENPNLEGIDPTQSATRENPVDRQLGIISRMSG
ncbi:MAG: hypothetical protein AB1589_37925 [Cyanobacteriota bacterium]